MNDVESGISELQSKMTGITDGMNQPKDGALEMKGGTQEFKDETSDIDTQIMEGIEKELENMTGWKLQTGFICFRKKCKC